MRKEELIKELINTLTKYKDYNFYFHQVFLTEFIKLANKVSYQENFLTQFVTALTNIREYTYNIYKVDSHEHLINTPFYSIHLQCKNYNIRLLISFSKRTEPIFLVAFYERAGKNNTGYSKAISCAKIRLQNFEKENKL